MLTMSALGRAQPAKCQSKKIKLRKNTSLDIIICQNFIGNIFYVHLWINVHILVLHSYTRVMRYPENNNIQ